MLAGLFFMAAPVVRAEGEPSPHGKTMVRSYELPAHLLDQYNAAVESQQAGKTDALNPLEAWAGTEFSANRNGNPYTLVVKVLASAVEDEDLGVRWQPAWSGSPGTMPGMGVPGARPGQLFQMVVASGPEEVVADRLIVPGLVLAAAKNIRMERVRVEIWSGVGTASWVDPLLEWWPLFTGIVVWTLLLIFLHHERKKTRRTGREAASGEPPEN